MGWCGRAGVRCAAFASTLPRVKLTMVVVIQISHRSQWCSASATVLWHAGMSAIGAQAWGEALGQGYMASPSVWVAMSDGHAKPAGDVQPSVRAVLELAGLGPARRLDRSVQHCQPERRLPCTPVHQHFGLWSSGPSTRHLLYVSRRSCARSAPALLY